jgi:hypothetical protein
MFSTEGSAEYLERAGMHEQLAASTDDIPARKMHQAMAAEYRRKAAEMEAMQIAHPPSTKPVLKFDIAAR